MPELQVFGQPGKGRRLCPALQGWIASLTCGRHRLKDIRCTADCKYLDQHERFRHAKAAEAFHLAWAHKVTPIYQRQDRMALDWLLACEFALYQLLKETPSITDEVVVEALKFLQRKLSPIQVIEAVGPALGRAMVTKLEANLKQPNFDSDAAQSVVQMLIELFEDHLGNQPREALNGFMGHLEVNFDLTDVAMAKAKENDKSSFDKPRIIVPR